MTNHIFNVVTKTDRIFQNMDKKPKPTRTVKQLSNVDDLSISTGPRGKDALGRETAPAWVAVQNAKGERVYVYGGGV